MANRPNCRCRAAQTVQSGAQAPSVGPTAVELPVRRWPHPIEETVPAGQIDPTLHYIRCALSYQNQMLADIKTLLQQLLEAESAEKKES